MITDIDAFEDVVGHPCDLCGKHLKDRREAVLESDTTGRWMNVYHAACYFEWANEKRKKRN